MCLPKAVVGEEVVEERDDAIRTFAHTHPLINEVIDLYSESECHQRGQKVRIYLSGYCLATHTEYATLPRSEEVNWPRLLRVVWDVDLKGIEITSIVTIVCCTLV